MSNPVTTIGIGDYPTLGLTSMAKRHVTHLVVVNQDGKIAGIISQKDLVVWFMKRPTVLLGL